MAKEIEGTRIILSGIASYPKLAKGEEKKDDKTGETKTVYSMVVLLDATQVTKAKKAVLAALKDKFGDKAADVVKKKQVSLIGGKGSSIRDDLKDGTPEGVVGYINARSYTRKPQVVTRVKNAEGKPTEVPEDKIADTVYPGAKVNVSATAYYSDRAENKGVWWALNNVQFAGDGERLDSQVAASDEFEADEEGADLSDLDDTSSAQDEDQDIAALLK